MTKGAVQQHSDRCWPACQQIRTWLDTHAMADIWLEMCDEDATRLMRSFPVHPLDRAVRLWPRLEGPIIDALRSTDCLAMTLVRRGRETVGSWPSISQETVVDQRHITVLVTIPEDSSIDWASVRDEIVNILEEVDVLDVAVEIHRGRLWPAKAHSGTFLSEDDWKKPAKGGASIGPVFEPQSATTWPSSSLSMSSSALGGFVEVCWEDGSWHTYALTCYHAVFPPTRPPRHFPVDDNGWSTWSLPLPGRTPLSDQRAFLFPETKLDPLHWHRDGFRPADVSKLALRMSQPSVGDAKSTIDHWTTKLAKQETDPKYTNLRRQTQAGEFIIPSDAHDYFIFQTTINYYRTNLDHAHAFLTSQSHLLGSLWAASGIRRTDADVLLDWTLVDLGDRPCLSNTVITRLTIDHHRSSPINRLQKKKSSQKINCSMHSLRPK